MALSAVDEMSLEEVETLLIRKALARFDGNVSRAAEVLGLSRQAVDKRRSSNQLLALTQGRRGYSYPGFQLEESKTLSGLEDVLKALSALDPWMQLNFFTSPTERLGGKTPIETLRERKVNDVISIASAYGEQGAM